MLLGLAGPREVVATSPCNPYTRRPHRGRFTKILVRLVYTFSLCITQSKRLKKLLPGYRYYTADGHMGKNIVDIDNNLQVLNIDS